MIQLIVYGLLAAGAVFAVHSFLNSYEDKGAAKQLAADRPIIEACKVDLSTAVKANVSLQTDLAKLAAERKSLSDAVAALGIEGNRLAVEKDKALAAAQVRLKAYSADNVSLRETLAAAAQPKGESCATTLADVDDNLRGLARQRVRFNPGADGSVGRDDAAADKGSGARSMSAP